MTNFTSLGGSNFKSYREDGFYYIDKTRFLIDFYEGGQNKVTLITRPRRFGKSMLLSMLHYFWDITQADSESIFKGLQIAVSPFWSERHQYPTIFISFSNLSTLDEESFVESLHSINFSLYKAHITQDFKLDEDEKNLFERVRTCKGTVSQASKALTQLMEIMAKHYGRPVVVLIDEYDMPIQDAPLGSEFQKNIIAILRQCLRSALKDNINLKFAILTGVQRIAKESLFSGLNNVDTCTVLDHRYATACGFTQEELLKTIQELNLKDIDFPTFKKWYNGYSIGGIKLYNPWSVIYYFLNKNYQPYWVNTSSNQILVSLFKQCKVKILDQLYKFSLEEGAEVEISNFLSIEDLNLPEESIWSILCHSGYLTLDETHAPNYAQGLFFLKIPNLEIMQAYSRVILGMFDKKLSRAEIFNLPKYLFEKNLEEGLNEFEKKLRTVLLEIVSFLDTAYGESYYHGLMTGLFLNLRDHCTILSNRESGHGRSDILIIPDANYSTRGYVLEFKLTKDTNCDLNQLAHEGVTQIEKYSYSAALGAHPHIQEVIALGLAFRSKELALCYKKI